MLNRSFLTFALAMAGAEVLVLGTYHMANPGHDIFKMQTDDVLTPKRQAEIGTMIETLKRFQPAKIGVERDAGDTRLSKDYDEAATESRVYG